PTDLPPPLAARQPEHVQIDLETMEVTGQLNEDTTYHYWTFNGQVPGPFVRVRVGDEVEVHLTNAEDSAMMHNIDFHDVTGPGAAAAPRRPKWPPARPRASSSRPSTPASMSTTAPPRCMPSTSPTACTA